MEIAVIGLWVVLFLAASGVAVKKTGKKSKEKKKERLRIKAEEKTQKQAKEKERITVAKRRDLKARVQKYPVVEITKQELENIPKAQDLEEGFLKEANIGFQFICRNSLGIDEIILGHVVKGDDLFCDQWGAGLSVPAKGINRYRVKVV